MSVTTSARMQAVQLPVIPVVAGWVRETKGCISLGQGVASFGPPASVMPALAGFGQERADALYGPAVGLPELQSVVAAKLAAENGTSLAGRKVIITAGSNLGFLEAMMVTTSPGDEVILPTPYFFNQEMAIRMVGAVPVCVPTDASNQLDLRAMEAAITPRTRAIVTVSPNNPTGAVYPGPVLDQVNALCARRGLFHLSDEAYEYFVFDGARHHSPASRPGSEAHTIAMYSLSKAYGFASWRVGYLVVPEHLHEAFLKAQDTAIICPPTITQRAAVAAMAVGASHCRAHLPGLEQVRAALPGLLAPLGDSVQVAPAQGAFYLFLRLPRCTLPDLTLVERLIREFGVAVMPGSAFGFTQGCAVRLSYGALAPETAQEGLKRLVTGLSALAR